MRCKKPPKSQTANFEIGWYLSLPPVIISIGKSQKWTLPILLRLDVELVIFFLLLPKNEENLKPELKVLSNSGKSLCFPVTLSYSNKLL